MFQEYNIDFWGVNSEYEVNCEQSAKANNGEGLMIEGGNKLTLDRGKAMKKGEVSPCLRSRS